jgi:hypothetical protein
MVDSKVQLASSSRIAHYFVDESGDGVLFNAKGQVLVGQPGGAMGHFIMGLLEADDPVALSLDLEQLRADLKADPYFKNVPSFQPERGKTAVAFHAKDDLPEVRRRCSSCCCATPSSFMPKCATCRRCCHMCANAMRATEPTATTPTSLYDSSVARLFKNRLHQYESCRVCYAVRGSSDRTKSFAFAGAGA